MIGLEDRQVLAQDIEVAHGAGARLRLACEIAGIDERTLQSWKAREDLYSRKIVGWEVHETVPPIHDVGESPAVVTYFGT